MEKPTIDFDAMTDEVFECFCRSVVHPHLDFLMPIAEKFHDKPVRQVLVWSLSFVISVVRDMGPEDRRWISSFLRRAADFAAGNQQADQQN